MNKVALVTGGAKRVGREVALMLAETGMDIAFTWNTSEKEAENLLEEIQAMGRKVVSIKVDNTQSDAVEIIVNNFTKKFNRLDVLINNASCFEPSLIGEITQDRFDHDMVINARVPLLLTQAFATMLAENYSSDDPTSTGRVVNFIDTYILGEPLRDYMSYNASKAALLEIANTFALELAPEITVNAVAPGVVEWASCYTEKMKKEFIQRVPLGRVGTAKEAANAVKFLVLDAHYCSGLIIKVDGGRHLT